MDALQFGRWLSHRRRHMGFSSQRTLVTSVCQDPLFQTAGISEDFLARLEAGTFVHPFRGSVRKRVFALAWFFCQTPRDVKTYLRAAEITDLDADESEQVHLLNKRLDVRQHQQGLPLPPRPQRLIGREDVAQELITTLYRMDSGLSAITGMAGIGKSTLAFEVVHRLIARERERLRNFPDGIAAFSCTGYRGGDGLVALLDDIITAFEPLTSLRRQSDASAVLLPQSTQEYADGTLARAMNRTRLVFAEKRPLLLLDDVDGALPLRLLLEALLPQKQQMVPHQGKHVSEDRAGVVFITSRSIPPPALITHHLHLETLGPNAALACLTAFLDQPLQVGEEDAARRICAAIGYLPLAIEAVVTAHRVKGIPLSLLAAHICEHPLDDVLDDEYELRSRLTHMLAPFDARMQKHFALLSMLGVQSFGLASAAALDMQTSEARATATVHPSQEQPRQEGSDLALASQNITNLESEDFAATPVSVQLASTAADLGKFVRHSLIELAPETTAITAEQEKISAALNTRRYRLHPLLYAHAQNSTRQLVREDIEAAKGNVQAYALTYVEHYKGDKLRLACEKDFLLASLKDAYTTQRYANVVHFVEGLASLVEELPDCAERQRLFLRGVHASRVLQDHYHLTDFLQGLGRVYRDQGNYLLARQAWTESMELISSFQHPAPMHFWTVLVDLAEVAALSGEYEAALRYTGQFVRKYDQHGNDALRAADARYCYAVFARLKGDLNSAYRSISSAVNLISQPSPTSPSPVDRFIGLRVQAELARVQGDYAASQAVVDLAAAIVLDCGKHFMLADLLFDQARFTHQQGMFTETKFLIERVMHVAQQEDLPTFHQRGQDMLQHLPETGSR